MLASEGLRLLQEIQDGSYAAFEDFYNRYAGMVYRVALQKTGDAAEAEDVCQDVFLEILDKPDQYDPNRGSVEAWLMVKAKSRSLDRLRRKQRIRLESWEHVGMRQAVAESVDDKVLARLELDSVRTAMQAIPAPQKRALVGAYFEQQTHRELAASLNRPLGTVKTLIRSGLQQLRRNLENQGLSGHSGGGGHHE